MKEFGYQFLKVTDTFVKSAALCGGEAFFCFAFNLRALLRKKDIRFVYNKVEKIFEARTHKYKKVFYSKKQNWECYSNGIAERGQFIGRTYFCNQIKFSDSDLVIDCGANVGDLKIYFDEANIKVRYVGIEPSPREYKCLRKNVAESEALQIGLWFEPGVRDLYVSSNSADSSYIEPPEHTGVISTRVARLDSLFDEPIKLLKIDAEGAEPEVLLGCTNLLKKIEFIAADLGPERGLARETTLVQVTNYLLTNGFEIVGIRLPRVVALYRRQRPNRG